MADVSVFVGLGANLAHDGETPAHSVVSAAKQVFEQYAGRLRRAALSALYQSPAYPPSDQPDYVNAVLALHFTNAPMPETVLGDLLQVERGFGRIRTKRWAARPLDLDLLAYGDRIVPDEAQWRAVAAIRGIPDREEHLTLPHPRLHHRDFVLLPLRDVAPGWVHPVLADDIGILIGALPDGKSATAIDTPPAQYQALQRLLAGV